jgi:hypothetical protein
VTGSEHSQTARGSSWTVRLHHGPSNIFCWIVRPYTGSRGDDSGDAIYDGTIQVYPWNIWLGCGPSDPLSQTVWVHVHRTRGYTIYMHSFHTHRSSTTLPHQQHIITMPCHLMCLGMNILRPPQIPRDIGQEGVALIGHLTHILNIPGRKADKIMSDNLKFSPQT